MQNQQKSVPGQDTSTLQKVLNVGTSALQSYKPVKQICQHVCAFHFYAQDMSRQVCRLYPACPNTSLQAGQGCCTLQSVGVSTDTPPMQAADCPIQALLRSERYVTRTL